MSTPPAFQLSPDRAEAARGAATRAADFLARAGYPLGQAIVAHHWDGGPAVAVVDALAAYQNTDGGFGNGLEVDIASPASNPFATRLAMHVLLGLRERPTRELETRLQKWLSTTQHDDGDWHFTEETRSGDLAPWFAGWTFPSLNPACCLAGLANALGMATPAMLDRVARLFADKASLDEARSGEFYNVLPYVEYLHGVDVPQRDDWLDAVAANINATESSDGYADAGHFWELAIGGGPDLVTRLSPDALDRQANRLLEEQGPDGGWPTPYNDAWRPWLTASNASTLAHLRDGIRTGPN